MKLKSHKKVQHEKIMLKKHKPQSLDARSSRVLTPRQKALRHFWLTEPDLMKKLSKQGTIVLHHKDVTLKHKNIARYDEWRPEDLIPMEKKAHISMHNKRKHTLLHNNRIARSKLKAREARAGKLVLAISPAGDAQVFLNAAQAAIFLGVSRQWTNYCLRNRNYVHGWALKLIDASQAGTEEEEEEEEDRA